MCESHNTRVTCARGAVFSSSGVQFFGPDGHKVRPTGSIMASYLHHINSFTRRYTVQQLYYVKMFVKANLCTNVRTHGCGDGANSTEAAMSPLLVRGYSIYFLQHLQILPLPCMCVRALCVRVHACSVCAFE
jgi:hypothetical protein